MSQRVGIVISEDNFNKLMEERDALRAALQIIYDDTSNVVDKEIAREALGILEESPNKY